MVLMLADDMGYSDLSCFGSEVPTPHLDRLAGNGLRFSQFYNAARCCPTRAALLTGLYSHQAGIGDMVQDRGPDHPAYRGFLGANTVTLAEVLRDAGYFTGMVGKWHVGAKPIHWPRQRGFDRFYGALAGGFYFGDSARAEVVDDDAVVASPKTNPFPATWYSTDAWTERGLQQADEALAAGKPFFLYQAHIAPHFPLQAARDDIARWRGRYREGWDVLRERRYRRQIELGVIDPAWPLSPRPPEVRAWDKLTAAEQDRFDLLMAIYAAVIERLDRSVGVLVEGLRARGVLENTVIVFISDNGGNGEGGVNGVMTGAEPGSARSDVWIGRSWATLANTPFRWAKRYTHEGGIASPCIVHWPAGLPAARRGKIEPQPAHVIDLMPTLVELAGAKYPEARAGVRVLPAEGTSLVPAWEGRPLARKAPLFFEHMGNRAVRDGNWKLVAERGASWQLHRMDRDRSELQDLAATEPAVVARLDSAYAAWSRRVGVEPYRPASGGKKGDGSP
jgi:arylsulfatase